MLKVSLIFELSIKNCKWLDIDLYKPPLQNEKHFLEALALAVNKTPCK